MAVCHVQRTHENTDVVVSQICYSKQKDTLQTKTDLNAFTSMLRISEISNNATCALLCLIQVGAWASQTNTDFTSAETMRMVACSLLFSFNSR